MVHIDISMDHENQFRRVFITKNKISTVVHTILTYIYIYCVHSIFISSMLHVRFRRMAPCTVVGVVMLGYFPNRSHHTDTLPVVAFSNRHQR